VIVVVLEIKGRMLGGDPLMLVVAVICSCRIRSL
jgi:hypothetical protein